MTTEDNRRTNRGQPITTRGQHNTKEDKHKRIHEDSKMTTL